MIAVPWLCKTVTLEDAGLKEHSVLCLQVLDKLKIITTKNLAKYIQVDYIIYIFEKIWNKTSFRKKNGKIKEHGDPRKRSLFELDWAPWVNAVEQLREWIY